MHLACIETIELHALHLKCYLPCAKLDEQFVKGSTWQHWIFRLGNVICFIVWVVTKARSCTPTRALKSVSMMRMLSRVQCNGQRNQ